MSNKRKTSTISSNDDDKDDNNKDGSNGTGTGNNNIKRSRSSRPSAISNIVDEESDDEPIAVCHIPYAPHI
jgi:hypothetical protein